MPLRLSSEPALPRSPQWGAGAGGRGGWLQLVRALGWGPMQQPPCPPQRAGTGTAPSLREITQRLHSLAGRRGGHPHRGSLAQACRGQAGWKVQLQAGKGDMGPEGRSLHTTAMALLAPPVLCLLVSIPVRDSIIWHKGLCRQTGRRGHRQREGRLCPALIHKPGERCRAEPPLPGPHVAGSPRSSQGGGRGFSLPTPRHPGSGTQHWLPPALRWPPNSPSHRTFANDDTTRCRRARATEDSF